jgi:hypothetical protein
MNEEILATRNFKLRELSCTSKRNKIYFMQNQLYFEEKDINVRIIS